MVKISHSDTQMLPLLSWHGAKRAIYTTSRSRLVLPRKPAILRSWFGKLQRRWDVQRSTVVIHTTTVKLGETPSLREPQMGLQERKAGMWCASTHPRVTLSGMETSSS